MDVPQAEFLTVNPMEGTIIVGFNGPLTEVQQRAAELHFMSQPRVVGFGYSLIEARTEKTGGQHEKSVLNYAYIVQPLTDRWRTLVLRAAKEAFRPRLPYSLTKLVIAFNSCECGEHKSLRQIDIVFLAGVSREKEEASFAQNLQRRLRELGLTSLLATPSKLHETVQEATRKMGAYVPVIRFEVVGVECPKLSQSD